MQFRKLTIAIAALAFLTPTVCLAEPFNITVNVSNITPQTGTLEISLFNSSESFMKEPYLQLSQPLGKASFHRGHFNKVPPGDYAVVVVHDENDNEKLDTGFLGFGSESYAFSNEVRTLFGWPDFDDAKFTVEEDTSIQIILD